MNTVIELTVARLKPAIKDLDLFMVLLDTPEYDEYLKQWVVKDSEGWTYATIATHPDGHDIILSCKNSLRTVSSDDTDSMIPRLAKRDALDTLMKEAYSLASEPPSKLAELENEYLALEIEEELLQNNIEKATKQIELDKKRLRDVAGKYRNDQSLKASKQDEIDKEKVRIENDTLARPVFTIYPQSEENYRVLKVTPKCVFLRRVPDDGEIRVLKDGSNLDCYSLRAKGFDLKATIKRFEEAKNG